MIKVKIRALLFAIAIVLVGIFALLYWQAGQNAPLEVGEFHGVRTLDIQQITFLRHPGDPNEVFRGLTLLSKGGYSITCYHQPNAKNPTVIQSLGIKGDGYYLEVWDAPIYRVYPLGVRVQEAVTTRYDVYWLNPNSADERRPSQLEEW
jgi:hypothetical protein